MSAASVGHTTDAVYKLQSGKTVDVSRRASESTDLLPPEALLRPRCGLQRPRPPALRRADYRLPPVIVLPLWMMMLLVVLVLLVVLLLGVVVISMLSLLELSYYACVVIYVLVVLLLLVFLCYMGERHTASILLLGVSILFLITA